MKNKYLIRLDDACPTMDSAKWQRMFTMLDSYGVRPMVGIIPHNEDPQQEIDTPDVDFWHKAQLWQQKGYAIALHGYNHCYISNKGLEGLNPLWERSEFAGVPLEVQQQKIRDGYEILKSYGITPKYFFAPSHTFDENTLKAIKACTDIRMISDTIAIRPYKKKGFIFLPQLGGHCAEMRLKGTWTFCLHPNTMTDEQFAAVERFLKVHKDEFIAFDEIDVQNVREKDLLSRLLSSAYFLRRKLRK